MSLGVLHFCLNICFCTDPFVKQPLALLLLLSGTGLTHLYEN